MADEIEQDNKQHGRSGMLAGTSIYWLTSDRTHDIFFLEIAKHVHIYDHASLKKTFYSKSSLLKQIQTIYFLYKNKVTYVLMDSYAMHCWITSWIAKKIGIKIIQRVRGGMNNEYLDKLNDRLLVTRYIKNTIRNYIRNRQLYLADIVATVSVFGKSQILYELPFLDDKKIHVVIKPTVRETETNGSEKHAFDKEISGKRIIATTTSFEYRRKFSPINYYFKSLAYILSKNPDWVWVIMGGGQYFEEEKNKLSSLAVSFNIREQIVFTGFVEDVAQILNISDIFFYPCFRDMAPQALKEAQLFSLPIVVNRSSCGPLEFIPPITICQKQIFEEPEELCNVITDLIQSKKTRHIIGKLNQEYASTNYELHRNVHKFLSLLRT